MFIFCELRPSFSIKVINLSSYDFHSVLYIINDRNYASGNDIVSLLYSLNFNETFNGDSKDACYECINNELKGLRLEWDD